LVFQPFLNLADNRIAVIRWGFLISYPLPFPLPLWLEFCVLLSGFLLKTVLPQRLLKLVFPFSFGGEFFPP